MAMSPAQAELLEAARALCAAFAHHDRVPSAWPVARRFAAALDALAPRAQASLEPALEPMPTPVHEDVAPLGDRG